jgi:hypothetical protein
MEYVNYNMDGFWKKFKNNSALCATRRNDILRCVQQRGMKSCAVGNNTE